MIRLKRDSDVFSIVLIFAILIVIFFIFFNSRQIFFHRYEPEYFENWYYHSQWLYPQSARGMSDGPYYQFVGYRLVHGENPFNINFEMPPFGKYLYGLGAVFFGNSYWVSIFLYLLSVLVFFLLSKDLFKNSQIALLALLLFVTTPFVATQVRETMLDLPLMSLYLIHVWLFIKFLSTRKHMNLLLAGIFLGLATATKPGLYTPAVAILGLILVFFAGKKIFNPIFYAAFVLLGYVLAYFPVYFIRHPNPIPWLRLHEKILKFYLNAGNGQPNYLNQWKTIFISVYQGIWEGGQKIVISDWSPVLPLGVIATVAVLILGLKKRHIQWVYLSGICLIFLTVNTFIPFWPRYLMPIIPIFVLLIIILAIFTTFFSKRIIYVVLFLSFLNLPNLVSSLTHEDLSGHFQSIARFVSTRAYRELYRSINPEQRKTLSEQEFIRQNESFLDALGTINVEMSVKEVSKSKDAMKVKYRLRYETTCGNLSHDPTLTFVRVNNQVKLVWKWDYLWPGYDPKNKVAKEKIIPFLKFDNNKAGVQQGNRKAVYVIPRLMFDWNKYLNALAEITGESSLEIDKRLKRVVPDQYPRFVGYLSPALGSEGEKKALKITGVSLRNIDCPITLENVP